MLRASILLLTALLLVGCSDDEREPQESDTEAVEQGIADLYAGDHATEEDSEAGACFASELVERAGVERLRDAGIVADSGEVPTELPAFDDETARLWVEAQFACTDYVEESTRALVAQSKGKLDPEAYAACLREAITDAELREAVVASLTGAWEAPEVNKLADAQARCSSAAPAGRVLGRHRHHDPGPVAGVEPGAAGAQQPGGRPAQERHRDHHADLPVRHAARGRRTPARSGWW